MNSFLFFISGLKKNNASYTIQKIIMSKSVTVQNERDSSAYLPSLADVVVNTAFVSDRGEHGIQSPARPSGLREPACGSPQGPSSHLPSLHPVQQSEVHEAIYRTARASEWQDGAW